MFQRRKAKMQHHQKPQEQDIHLKKMVVLNVVSICQLSIIDCCMHECLRYFPRKDVLSLQFEFYVCSPRLQPNEPIHVHGKVHCLHEEGGKS